MTSEIIKEEKRLGRLMGTRRSEGQQDGWERRGVNTKTVFENTIRYLRACSLMIFNLQKEITLKTRVAL